MTTFHYLDTSALVKRYVEERGSDEVIRLFTPELRFRLCASALGMVELRSAMARRRREGSIAEDELDVLCRRFEVDWTKFLSLLSIDEATLREAARLVLDHPIRASDAVHLATAFRVRENLTAADDDEVRFHSSDQNLSRITALCGFTVPMPGIPST